MTASKTANEARWGKRGSETVSESDSNRIPNRTPNRIPTKTKPEPIIITPTGDRAHECFAEFWEAYGKVGSKNEAIIAYDAASKRPGVTSSVIIAEAKTPPERPDQARQDGILQGRAGLVER